MSFLEVVYEGTAGPAEVQIRRRSVTSARQMILWLLSKSAGPPGDWTGKAAGGPEVVFERCFKRAEDLLGALERFRAPDLVMVEIQSEECLTTEFLRCLQECSRRIKVVVLTDLADPSCVRRLAQAGVCGYLLRSSPAEKIIEAVLEVHDGGAWMSPAIAKAVLEMLGECPTAACDYHLTLRERLCLQRVVRGLSKKEIANDLSISFHTVDSHLRNIYRKLRVNTRSAAVAKAIHEQLC